MWFRNITELQIKVTWCHIDGIKTIDLSQVYVLNVFIIWFIEEYAVYFIWGTCSELLHWQKFALKMQPSFVAYIAYIISPT